MIMKLLGHRHFYLVMALLTLLTMALWMATNVISPLLFTLFVIGAIMELLCWVIYANKSISNKKHFEIKISTKKDDSI